MNGTLIEKRVSQRNYGIDLLRLVSSFYVIILHTINQGGVYSATVSHTYQNYVCKLLLIFSICAVNIFGIISGYVGYRDTEKNASFSGFFPLWLSVVFYNVLICAVYMFLLPDTVTGIHLLHMFFPLSKNLYWYFSAYTLVYFLSPHLNKILQNTSEKDLRKFFYLVCFVIVPLEYLGKCFNMGNGYSPIWLLFLYLIGAILKKCQIGKNIPAFALIGGILITNLGFYILNEKFFDAVFFIFDLDFKIDSSYITPFFLAPAIFHVILFSRFQFHKPFQKIIAFCSPAIFFVYIVNVHPHFWYYYMYKHFVDWSTSSPAGIVARTILFSFVFVSAVIIIDFFRQKLFHILGVQNWPQIISSLFQKYKTV